ncbi:MAG: hypothetical protein Q9221_003839 [Calogaya cf. arnoldii]
MASNIRDDPFLEAQAFVRPAWDLRIIANVLIARDVLSTLNTTRSLYSSYVRIRSTASSASSPELAQARSELETTLYDLTSDLQDLVDSVKAIESDPFRYGVDIDEVARRRKLVEEVGREVEDMGKELKKVANNQKRDGANASTLPPPSAFDPDALEGDDYEAFEQQRQVEIMHEQDEALDGVFKTVGNLRQQANDMGRELEEQHIMLDEVDTLADRVGGKLQTGIKKVGWVIKKNEGGFPHLTVSLAEYKLILLRYNVKLLHRRPHLRADSSFGTATHSLMDEDLKLCGSACQSTAEKSEFARLSSKT